MITAIPPRVRVVPDAASWDDGDDAALLAETYLNPLHDWQCDVVSSWLGCDAAGKYTAGTCGLLVPRQNGKTEVIATRILWGLLYANGGRGERIRYSAHRVDTTLEMFDRIVWVFGDERAPEADWPFKELHDLVEHEVFTNGHQRVTLKSGAEVRFSARSTGSSRGFTMDVQIFDEAGFLTDQQLAASRSTTSAAPRRNPQTIYAGTPPNEQGLYAEPFSRVREKALAGARRVCWHEWSVERFDKSMLTDREVWRACNPSLGLNLLESAVEDELTDLTAEGFAIERLCWWPPKASEKAVDQRAWDASAVDAGGTPDDDDIVKTAVGVKFDPEGGRVCVSVAAKTKEGAHVELLFDEPTSLGSQWLVDYILEGRETFAAVGIDGRTGAGNLQERLVNAKFPKKGVRVLSSAEAVTAASMLNDMLADGHLTHLRDATLDASAKGAVKRRIGRDGRGFGGDSCAIESASIALHQVMTTKRNPKRKQRIG